MPTPLHPVAAIALRTGALALAVWAVKRGLDRGRTDQRAEDALDDLDDGLALHRPLDRDGQTNAGARFRRRLTWQGGGVEVDASMLARVRIRKL